MELKFIIPLLTYTFCSIYFIYKSKINNRVALTIISSLSLIDFFFLINLYNNKSYLINPEITYLTIFNLIINGLVINFLFYKSDNFIFNIESFIDNKGTIVCITNAGMPLILFFFYFFKKDITSAASMLYLFGLNFLYCFICMYIASFLDKIFYKSLNNKEHNILFRKSFDTISDENLKYLTENFNIKGFQFLNLYKNRNINLEFHKKDSTNEKPLFIAILENVNVDILYNRNYWLNILLNKKEVSFKYFEISDSDFYLPINELKNIKLNKHIDFKDANLKENLENQINLIKVIEY
jgi:hypothetical protein